MEIAEGIYGSKDGKSVVKIRISIMFNFIKKKLNINMEQMIIKKDLMGNLTEYFETHPDLLPAGVILKNVNIIGGYYEFSSDERREMFNHEVVFRGPLGNPEWKQNYDLVFNGLLLIDVRKSNAKIS
ncbi:MAG TPA: hypothetical protein VIQ77_07710 [Mucilaginibacter sp.]